MHPTARIAAPPTSLVSVSVFLVSKLPACGLNVLPILAFVLNPHLPTRPAGKLFAWNSIKSERARRKCCFAPIVLAWFLLFLGVCLLAVLFLAFLSSLWAFGPVQLSHWEVLGFSAIGDLMILSLSLYKFPHLLQRNEWLDQNKDMYLIFCLFLQSRCLPLLNFEGVIWKIIKLTAKH